MNMDFWRPLKESKPDPPTNRRWLESLTDKELAEFLTVGLYIHDRRSYVGNVSVIRDYVINLNDIKGRYTQTHTGLIEWLKSEQEFEVIKEVSNELHDAIPQND